MKKMYMYKYMGGLEDAATHEGEDDSFDPHMHRKVAKPTTYAETMTHMLKGSFGAGLLAMPDAVSRLGIVFGAISIILIGIFATYCIQLLIFAQYKVCKKWRRGYMAYHKCMRLAVEAGPPFMRKSALCLGQAVDIMLLIWQVGICAIYVVFVAENVYQVLDYYGHHVPLRMLMIYSFPVLLLASLIKDLKLLTPFSTISNFLMLLGIILVFFYLVQEDVVFNDDKLQLKGIGEIPIFIGIVLFALEAVGVILALEYSMEKPKEFTGLFGLFSVGMAIIVATFVLLGIFGYLKYGDDIMGVVTLNLPRHEKKAQVAKLAFAVSLLLSFPLQNYVAYQILYRKILKKINPKRRIFADWTLRVMLVIIPYVMALAAPSLGAFMGLLGALCLSMVAMVFPAIMDICVHYPKKYGHCHIRLIADILIIIFGTFCMCSGVYTSVLEIVEKYNL